MNPALLLSSFKNLIDVTLVISLSTWIYNEIAEAKYTDSKLIKSFNTNEFETIIRFNKDKTVLDTLILRTPIVVERVKLLLEHGANVHINDNILLNDACKYRNMELAKILLQYDADSNIYDYRPMYNAYQYDNLDTVNLLLEHALQRKYHKYKLHQAINDNSSVEVVRSILEYEPLKIYDINIEDNYNSKRLFREACVRSSIDVIKLLIEHGADIHGVEELPFRAAVIAGRVDVVKYLLEVNIGMKAVDEAISDLKYYKEHNKEIVKILYDIRQISSCVLL